MAIGRCIAVIVLAAAALQQPCFAQDVPGFERVRDEGDTVSYATSDKTVLLTLGRAGDAGAPLEPVMRQMAQRLTPCQGLAAAPIGARGPFKALRSTGALNCELLGGGNSEGSYVVLVLAMPAAKTDGGAAAARLLGAKIGSASSPPATPPPGGRVAAGGDMFAAVPAAARPVAMVQRKGYTYSGVITAFTLTGFALFANGYALDGCASFDPRQGPPTPALAARDRDCTVLRWRKAPGGYVLLDEDGKLEEPQPAISAFRKGERLSIDYRTSSSYSSGFVTPPGGVAVNALFSNELHLAADGTIRTRASSGVAVSGDTIGGGSGRDTGLVAARYALDGHLMAVTDAAGTRFRLIGRKIEGGDLYIHLDGRLFWKDD